MRCAKCGEEIIENEKECRKCEGLEQDVRVLSPDERDRFKGLTIQQGQESPPESGRGGSYEYSNEGPGHRVYVRQVSFGSSSMGWIAKLLLLLFFLFILFIALPVALVTIAVAIIWLLIRRR
jgi:hypothetical protein